MKGIIGELGEMKIPLKPDLKLVKKMPYQFNPIYKEKVKQELEMMLKDGIIELVDEWKWVCLMVAQNKKTWEIKICMDLWKLNKAYAHDPFPTLFTNKILENVGGEEAYSFTYGLLEYCQVGITKEDQHKITFVMEWVCFQ